MGIVHKFKRPPKNERQFRGYRPRSSESPSAPTAPRRSLRSWQQSAIAWLILVLVAVAIWAATALIGDV
jgi:hypothetical protein